MIQIRFKITPPLMILLLLGLFAWLVRDPGSSKRQQPVKPRRPRPDRFGTPIRPARTIIFTGDDDRPPSEQISYEEALRSGRYSPEELTTIGNREAMEAGFNVYEQAQQMHVSMPTPNWRKQS